MTDFGISKQLEQTFGMARSFVGTAAYMAPERIAGDDYGTAADIWAVGIVLCECAQGAHPYKHMQSYYDLVLELSEGGRPPRLPSPPFSAELAALCAACLATDPAARPAAAPPPRTSASTPARRCPPPPAPTPPPPLDPDRSPPPPPPSPRGRETRPAAAAAAGGGRRRRVAGDLGGGRRRRSLARTRRSDPGEPRGSQQRRELEERQLEEEMGRLVERPMDDVSRAELA